MFLMGYNDEMGGIYMFKKLITVILAVILVSTVNVLNAYAAWVKDSNGCGINIYWSEI